MSEQHSAPIPELKQFKSGLFMGIILGALVGLPIGYIVAIGV